MSKAPDQHYWTFRFKRHKTTILLFVTETQTFTSIKADLLEAIKATGISEINGAELPADPNDIILGLPVDKNDLTLGWVDLEIPEKDDDEKETKSKGARKDSVLNASPLGAGLRDGAVLAFKFRRDDEDGGDWDVVMPIYEEEEDEV